MSKAIRWQVPFATNDPTNPTLYRVDIYDEDDGTWSGITQLQAGETPFTTDEDNSDNYFSPIRTQTGSLQICTRNPDGTMITLDELLSANNIARLVRLNRIDSSNVVQAIEWQGFLSCDAYSQAYTDIPENIDLPLISVLEAMDSVEVQISEQLAFNTILGHVAYAMKAIETQCGMSLFDTVYLSNYCRESMESYSFYNNEYFNTEEVVNGDNVVVEVHSITCKKILENVAEFFGGVWRENVQNLYLDIIGKTASYDYNSFADIKEAYLDQTTPIESWYSISKTSIDMANSTWKGTNHQRDIYQGRRRIKVSSKLKDFSFDISLRETPTSNLAQNPSARQTTWYDVYANTNETFYNLAEHKHIYSNVKVELASNPVNKKATVNRGYNVSPIHYADTWFWSDDQYLTNYEGLFIDYQGETLVGTAYHYVTSFMAYMRLKVNKNDEEKSLVSGLMICGLPYIYYLGGGLAIPTTWYDFAESDYLFKQQTPLLFAADSGKILLDIHIAALSSQVGTTPVWNATKTGIDRGIEMAIKWGNKWLQNSNDEWSWVDSFTTFSAKYAYNDEKGDIKLEFPISELNIGFITVYIYPKVYGGWTEYEDVRVVHNVFITKLDLKYKKDDEELYADRSENIYTADIANAFKEELSVDLELASDVKNTKVATMVWEDETTPATAVLLGGNRVRPEEDLLERLKEYYSGKRQKLKVIIEQPNTILPLLKLNGISPDTRKYLPLSESRDWQQDISTLTCFETPE